MNKKTGILLFILLILIAGFIAVTQEINTNISSVTGNDNYSFDWVRPAVWFRSNAGGMALEEIDSRIVALRNEYALSISFAPQSEIPEFFLQYLDEDCYPEIRDLYKDGEKIRTQWLLKNTNGITRLNASFSEPELTDLSELNNDEINNNTFNYIDGKSGFIEIFNRNSSLITEYIFYKNGNIDRISNEFNQNVLISSVFSRFENDSFDKLYADFYHYNRSMSLRSIERIFYSEFHDENEVILISFPRRIMDSADDTGFISGRINLYPEYFGGIILENNRIVYDTDTRGRILYETLYDEDENLIWVIENIWENNRIISSRKTEGHEEFLTEYEYNAGGEKILERNYKNSNLERILRREGNQDIEELYINDIMIMIAVWEDGRKISESRAR